jgi:nickel/cobalt transporter (NiCoT) family protein
LEARSTRLELVRRSMSRTEWLRLGGLGGIVLGLHILGFGVLLLVVAPRYSSVLGIGVGLTAWGFGLRHAFDADHIAAIDNTTRKLMADGKRPLAVGFFFSLGHSTVVFALSLVLAFAARSVSGAIRDDGSGLHSAGGYIGTGVSGFFLYLIAAINLVILVGIVRIFSEMRRGPYDEQTLEQRLNERGLINRLLGPVARSIRHSWQMYPIGVLFGLGFDTATEVGLLALAATAGGADLPWYAILCLPVIFAAGMSMMDTADGAFMSVAYGWAFSNPVRKVFYNLAITALSVAAALLVGTVELAAILASYTGHRGDAGGFWGFVNGIDLNSVGFVIVGMFVVTWVLAVSLWFFGSIEERWALAAVAARGVAVPRRSAHARKPLTLVAAQTWLATHGAIVATAVLYLAVNGELVTGAVGGAARALLVALVLVTTAALVLALTMAARWLDRPAGRTAWVLGVGLEAAVLVAGSLATHDRGGVIAAASIALPIVGLLLLLAPATIRPRRPRVSASPMPLATLLLLGVSEPDGGDRSERADPVAGGRQVEPAGQLDG